MPLTFIDGFEHYTSNNATYGFNGSLSPWSPLGNYGFATYFPLSSTTPYSEGLSLSFYRDMLGVSKSITGTVTASDIVVIGLHLRFSAYAYDTYLSNNYQMISLGNLIIDITANSAGSPTWAFWWNGTKYITDWLVISPNTWYHIEIRNRPDGVDVWQNGMTTPIFTSDIPRLSTPTSYRFGATDVDYNYYYFDNFYEAVDPDTAPVRYGVQRISRLSNMEVVSRRMAGYKGGADFSESLKAGSWSDTSPYSNLVTDEAELIFKGTVPTDTSMYQIWYTGYTTPIQPTKAVIMEGETLDNLRVLTEYNTTTSLYSTQFNVTRSDLTQDGDQTDGNGEYHLFGIRMAQQ